MAIIADSFSIKTSFRRQNASEKRPVVSRAALPWLFLGLLFAAMPREGVAFSPEAVETSGVEPFAHDATDPISTIHFLFGSRLERLSTGKPSLKALPEDAFLVSFDALFSEEKHFRDSMGALVFRISPMERRLLEDAADGQWDDHSAFRAALVSQGETDPIRLRRYEDRLERHLDRLREHGSETLIPEERARGIFEFMHRKILTGEYDIQCTDLREVLDSGNYNCVSATVLFNCIANRMGLEVCGLETPGHALSRIKFRQTSPSMPVIKTWMDLETTCSEWFQVRHDKLKREQALEHVVGGVHRTVGNMPSTEDDSAFREISEVQLIATIYYNQGVDALAQEQYACSARMNCKALHLDSRSETAWGNLLATLNNWAIHLASKEQRFDEASEMLAEGLRLDASYETFRANQLHIYYQWMKHLAEQGRYRQALEVFQEASKRIPQDRRLERLCFTIGHRYVRELMIVQRYEAAFEQLDAVRKLHLGEKVDPVEMELRLLHEHARQLLWNATEHQPADAGKAVWLLDLAIKRNAPRFAEVLWQEQDASSDPPAFRTEGESLQGKALLLAIMESRKDAIRRWLDESLRREDYLETVRRIHAATDQSILAEVAWPRLASQSRTIHFTKASVAENLPKADTTEASEWTPVQRMLGEAYRLWILSHLDEGELMQAMEVVERAREEKVLEGLLHHFVPKEML
jgi:tetratricopeptide (TPR) repeat protein